MTGLQLASFPAVSTRQNLTAGIAATYTTPAGCRQLKIRMWGGGGGGNGGNAASGAGNGGDTIFNSINAGGGKGDTGQKGGAGGTSATGSASFRMAGACGGPPSVVFTGATTAASNGGAGGGIGGGQAGAQGGTGSAGAANTGGGGGTGGISSAIFATIGGDLVWGGGGEGEYVEIIISGPAATYSYTIGAGGVPVTAGSGGGAGGAGGTGFITVDEFY